MPIVYQQGNIFENNVGLTVVAHQCNCRGTFGGGIAKEIKQRFPEVDRAQKEWYKAGLQTLGAVQIVPTHTGLKISNMYAQVDFKRIKGVVNTNYDALELCLQRLKLSLFPQDRLGMPKIGAGLGGGDWNQISTIINWVFQVREVYVYVI